MSEVSSKTSTDSVAVDNHIMIKSDEPDSNYRDNSLNINFYVDILLDDVCILNKQELFYHKYVFIGAK